MTVLNEPLEDKLFRDSLLDPRHSCVPLFANLEHQHEWDAAVVEVVGEQGHYLAGYLVACHRCHLESLLYGLLLLLHTLLSSTLVRRRLLVYLYVNALATKRHCSPVLDVPVTVRDALQKSESAKNRPEGSALHFPSRWASYAAMRKNLAQPPQIRVALPISQVATPAAPNLRSLAEDHRCC